MGAKNDLSDISEEDDKRAKKAFKAAKSNPTFYEDKNTKKQRRELEKQKR